MSMGRRIRCLLRFCARASIGAALAVGGVVVPAAAQTVVPTLDIIASEESGDEHEAETAVYAAPTTLDRIGRVMAPVMVNGQGPFRFILDTGASSSAVSPALVAKLGLVPSLSGAMTIQGATGSEAVPAVLIDRLQAGEIRLENLRLPVVASEVFANADGILGVEGFDNVRITIDFVGDRISIVRALRTKRNIGEWYKVPVQLRFGRLMIANASIGKLQVRAVIDTGAERTLGNLALRRALGLDVAAERARGQSQVIGATSAQETAHTLPSPLIHFGQMVIADVNVTFADLHVFRIWGLDKEPALVLGMDVLGTPNALVLDYRHGELLLSTDAAPVAIR